MHKTTRRLVAVSATTNQTKTKTNEQTKHAAQRGCCPLPTRTWLFLRILGIHLVETVDTHKEPTRNRHGFLMGVSLYKTGWCTDIYITFLVSSWFCGTRANPCVSFQRQTPNSASSFKELGSALDSFRSRRQQSKDGPARSVDLQRIAPPA